ncbi:Exocyst complex component SEC15B [Hibiscus syriacus]|uniref:Exocyst complex component SEC15B n=1 Tax=Hibiscus syriacus TaxID=106335 RepID=A0A6A2XN71_HIBSY|nr:Exocyst complex component SEC15B [Hibiscus syriacus]
MGVIRATNWNNSSFPPPSVTAGTSVLLSAKCSLLEGLKHSSTSSATLLVLRNRKSKKFVNLITKNSSCLGGPLLSSLDSFVVAQNVSKNFLHGIEVFRLDRKRVPSKEFGDWLVDIRVVSRNLGQLAIGQSSAARQREEYLRIKQRQAEEQSRPSLRGCIYALEEDDDEGELGGDENESYSNEDRILRTGGVLVSKMDVENLWETAVSKMCSVLEDQFSRMQTASHLLLIKDYVSLLGVTLRRYGYPVDALLVLSKHRDKYHELLLSDSRKQIAEALADDKFEQMLMKKEYKYSMNVLSFQLQTSDIVPAFPYVAPFSSTVPDCCRIARSFIEDSVSFMSYGGQLDLYDVAMQVAANMAVLEQACDFFFHHAAQLSGIPLRMTERSRKQFPLNKAREAAEEMLSGMLKRKVDSFLTLIENVNWMTDECSQGEKIIGALLGDSVKRFNLNAITGIDVDIRLLESFADNLSPALSEGDANQLKNALAESRLVINLLLSNQPENFLNPVIRERS